MVRVTGMEQELSRSMRGLATPQPPSKPAVLSILHACFECMRFRHHTSYLITVLTVLTFSAKLSWHTAAHLVIHYVLFTVCLYGGIHAMNGIQDADIDAKRPTKAMRPIPSGRISKPAVWVLIGVLWAAAFAGVYAWDGSMFFWFQYAAFIPVNVLYGLGVRRSRWRFTIAVTAPLRLRLGVLIAMRAGGLGAPVPLAAYGVACTVMACSQAVRFRLEATGDATLPLENAPLEILGVAFFICEALLVAAGQPAALIYAAAAAAGFIFFTMLPTHAPATWAWVLVATPPKPSRPNSWFMIAKMLLELRAFAAITKLVLLWCLAQMHYVCMGLEDAVFGTQLQKLTHDIDYVIGHPRSGTTSFHQAAIKHPKLQFSTFYDLWCPTLVAKLLLTPLKPLFAAVLSQHDTPNHRVALDEPSEEHMFCFMRGRETSLFVMFPELMRHPQCRKLAAEVLYNDENDVRFMLRCIARSRLSQNLFSGLSDSKDGTSNPRYLARVLGMTKHVDILRKVSPGSRFVVCERDPVAAVVSNVQMLANAIGISITDKHFVDFMNIHYKVFSKATFEKVTAMCAEAEGHALKNNGKNGLSEILAWRQEALHEDVMPVHFEQWKGEPVRVLREVLAWLLGDEVSEGEAERYTKGSDTVKHKNDPACKKIVKMN